MSKEELDQLFFKEVKKYPVDFFILGLIFLVAVTLFLVFSYNSFLQRRIVFNMSLAYFWWGVFHHWRKDSLCLRVALEYLLLAILGALLVIFVLL